VTQDTTIEFSKRFESAVDGHPLAPPSPYGRQAWVLEKLRKEVGLEVSPNTMSKWFNGTARPRADNIRKIAQVLQVDEVWLALGRKPSEQAAAPGGAERARGAVLLLAGLIEVEGGRVSFAAADEAPVDLHVNLNGESFDVVVATPKESDHDFACIVNEPTGESRVIAVAAKSTTAAKGKAKAKASPAICFDLYDLTHAERKRFGGFSVIEMTRGENSRIRVGEDCISPMKTIAEIS
jgi:transcriptional regulator with XRE-family HTH domain